MKKNILMATAIWFAFALAGTVACMGGSSGGGGCGGSQPASPTTQTLTCGRGTHQESGQCVANTTGTGTGSTAPH